MARCFWDTRLVSRQKCPFSGGFLSRQQEMPGTPASRGLFVLPVIQGHPAGVLRLFLDVLRPFFFPPFCAANLSRTSGEEPIYRGQKSTQTFFVQSFSKTLRVMDVRAENRGRPHQKVRFPAAPVAGRKFLNPWASGRKGQKCPREIRTIKLCLCLFFLP